VRERPHPTMDSSMSELDSVAAGAPRQPVDYCRRHPPIEVTIWVDLGDLLSMIIEELGGGGAVW
jgi:hypothetical protein